VSVGGRGVQVSVVGVWVVSPLPYVMDQVGHADSKTTLEIYAQVQKRVSRKNVHAAFDELLNGANRDAVRSPF
jgi:hypothetical protein